MTDAPPARRTNGVTAVAGDVVDAFKHSPTMLLMVVLNVAFLACAAFYLSKQEDNRSLIQAEMAKLIDRCVTQTVPIEVFYQRGAK